MAQMIGIMEFVSQLYITDACKFQDTNIIKRPLGSWVYGEAVQ